ncbi:MAG: putative alcohol dehydrogenase AdhA, partial [Chlamydiae bacterium]|nr:putative alcohol dehydrogenase AdhA [Chlamydiota bacterium]
MRAMVLEEVKKPLVLQDLPLPEPLTGQVRIKVKACSVCRTDLHIFDGELKNPKLPLVMGHQIVGIVEEDNSLVGIPWLGKSCGICPYCTRGEENLCDDPTFTGYNINGGFAEYVVAYKEFVFPLPKGYSEINAAPLLCAGMIGYRSLKMTKDAKKIGFYGFGAAAHLLIQVARYQKKEIYAFTRKGDIKTQEVAKKLGAVWAGDSETSPPDELDAAIIFAPVGPLIPIALKAVRKGGIVVCAGIHMSDIPSFPYEILWGERVLRSVANLTRKDGEEFLALAQKVPIQTEVTT